MGRSIKLVGVSNLNSKGGKYDNTQHNGTQNKTMLGLVGRRGDTFLGHVRGEGAGKRGGSWSAPQACRSRRKGRWHAEPRGQGGDRAGSVASQRRRRRCQ